MRNPRILTVYFDEQRAESEKPGHEIDLHGAVDYSPLRRVTGRTFWMGVLVSMGGLM